MSEKGIDMSKLDLDSTKPEKVKVKIDREDGILKLDIEHKADYYFYDQLIKDIAKKIHGEQDIEKIKDHLAFVYQKAIDNSLLDDIQDKIEFLEWKKKVDDGEIDFEEWEDYYDEDDEDWEDEDYDEDDE